MKPTYGHRGGWPEFSPPQVVEPQRLNRKRTFIFATVMTVIMLVMSGIDFVLQPNQFVTTNIDIVGDLGHSESDQLAATVAKISMGNILRVDITQAVEAAQSLSWVENATVRRKWPNTLEVQVNQRKIRARFNDNEYLDQFGTPFQSSTEVEQQLPHLSGPRNFAAEILTAYESWNTSVAHVGLNIQSLALSNHGGWEVVVSPMRRPNASADADVATTPITVRLGSGDINDRLRRFLKLYAEVFQSVHQNLAVIDLRYPDGVAVTWKGAVPVMKGSQSFANT